MLFGKVLTLQYERMATTHSLVIRLHLPHAIGVGTHVHKVDAVFGVRTVVSHGK